MRPSLRTVTATNITANCEGHIFRTARKLIERGFVEIAQGIRLIAEGTLRPVRSFVPSFVVLTSMATLTAVTLVLVVTTVAHADLQIGSSHAANATWVRWNSSADISFGDNIGRDASFERFIKARFPATGIPRNDLHRLPAREPISVATDPIVSRLLTSR